MDGGSLLAVAALLLGGLGVALRLR
jgi:hypothetical protein